MKNLLAIFALVCSTATHAQVEILLNIIGAIGSASMSQKEKHKVEELQLRQEAERKAEDEQLQADRASQAEWNRAEKARIDTEIAEAEKRREARAAALKNGRATAETIEDLEDLYSAEDGWDLAANPKLDADKDIYLISGVVEKREAGLLLCATAPEEGKFRGSYFAVRMQPKTKKPADIKDRLRVNGQIVVVGRYVRNLEYNTIGAGQKIMPVLDAVHLVIPESY